MTSLLTIRDPVIGASGHNVGHVLWPLEHGNSSYHASHGRGAVAFKSDRTSDVHFDEEFVESVRILKSKNQCYVTISRGHVRK